MALGVGSSLDVNSIVSQLMQVEQQPLTALATKEAKYQAQLSAYGSLKGALSTFQTAVAALANPAKFSAVTASLADTTVASVSASSAATAGSYAIKVTTLAQSQKLQSDSAFALTSDPLGYGTLTISFGTYTPSGNPGVDVGTFTLNPDKTSKTITIGAGQSSLSGVRDAINAANVGVSANIVNDGTTGNHLVITSNDSGVANALRITVADADFIGTDDNIDNTGLSQLAFDPAAAPQVLSMTETVAATNASAIIDGITISKASNTITDAIQGVTLNLLKVNATATTLTVARDTAATQTAVQSFVTAYNNVNKIITDLSKYDLVNKKAAVLTGDSALVSLKSQLRAVFNTALSTAGGGLTALPDIGITFQKDGTLALDSTKLNTVLSNPTKDVSTLFAAVGKLSDSLVTFGKSTTATKNGIYALNVSQLATQGKAVGGVVAGLIINSGSNDTLSLTIDGKAASVTLAAGTYTAAALADEIQSKINGASALSSAGISVAVKAELIGPVPAIGTLTITSNRYGSGSTVTTIAGTAAAAIFGTIDYTNGAGLDAAGTIGGVAATGNGQTLTGAGDASGLALTVAGGATGARGSVNFARGYAYELDKLVGKMLENKSLIDSRVGGINASIKDIGTRREELNLRLDSIEKRYRAQFTALDGMLSRMNQTSNYLTQQLANLPGSGN